MPFQEIGYKQHDGNSGCTDEPLYEKTLPMAFPEKILKMGGS
jgi:hypothetical protein